MRITLPAASFCRLYLFGRASTSLDGQDGLLADANSSGDYLVTGSSIRQR
jgi:hypothetical protein